MALPIIAAGLAGLWAAKKIYDIATDDSDDDADQRIQRRLDAERKYEARQALQREEKRLSELRILRRLQQNNRIIKGELRQIHQKYLEPVKLPVSFNAEVIQAFQRSKFDDRASVENALGKLWGKPVHMRERENSCVKALQEEMQALKKLEQFIQEV